MSRIWKYKSAAVKEITPELIAAADDLPILANLLAIRGITTPEEARAFLNLSDYQPTPPDAFDDMAQAVERIRKAIDDKEHILIYGDFDVDGITGTSVLMQTLRQLKANASFYIPDRHTEGHGLNSTALIRLVSARQVKLVITTDTGITNFNEVQLIKGLGVDTIITDHHEMPENLPPSLANLTPKLLPPSSSMAFLAGVGVAYKLSQALLEDAGAPQSSIDALLDLVAIGTVVDMVPLLRENRYLVWRGLQVLARRERPGIKAILEEAGVNETAPIDSQTLGFVIGPRLNAIGRIANAAEAVDLLTTDDVEQARVLAARLEQYNRKRKDLVEECLIQAEKHLLNTGELTDQKAIILSSRDWNQGIVGLVATKLIDKFHRPCFIGHVDDETQEIRFSARSIEGFNMHQNLQELEDLFIRWGGHSGAAGFAIAQKDLPKLKDRLFRLCNERITDQQMNPILWMDMKLAPSQVNPYLVEIVNKMAPFGQENPLPVFGLERISVGAQKLMGEDQRHIKLILTNNEPGQYLEAIQWNWAEKSGGAKINPKSTYRFAFTAEINTYNGTSKVQLLLRDFQDESVQVAPATQVNEGASQVAGKKKNALPARMSESEPPPVVAPQGGMQWIDHRGRDEIESFLAQILAATQEQPADSVYRIFCEGNQQYLPMPMNESLFCKRNGSLPDQTAQNVILWDLPPDMQSLTQLLHIQKPKVVHLVGGKYQKIPICRSPREYLDGLHKVLQRHWKQEQFQPVTLELSKLATLLSTSQQVIVSGLSLLTRLELAMATVLPEDNLIRVDLPQVPEAVEADISRMIEFIAFRSALDDVHRFREWLMTAPLDRIQMAVSLELSTTVDRQERERHVLDIR